MRMDSIDQSSNTSKKMSFGYTRLLLCLCPVLIVIFFLITKRTNENIAYQFYPGKETKLNSQKKSFDDSTCSWRFHNYTPSAWETYWYSNIESFQYEVCSILARPDQINKTIDAVLRTVSLQKSIFDANSKAMPIDNHFSKMHYQGICANKKYNAVQLVEPLIGLIRDPLTMCPHVSSVPPDLYLEGGYEIQSKRFLLLAPSSPYQIERSYPSKIPPLPPWLYSPGSQKILIDIGSSYFKSRHTDITEIGTKWFYDYFISKSIRFDRIIAYEYENLETRRVWEELPDDIFPIYTFINIGVEEKLGRFNPWTMLEAIAKPTDYVIIKLDIDKPPLENALIKQLFNEKNRTRDLIDEIFFEKHVSNKKESNEEKLKDTYELFTKLRQSGIRMHGWP